MKKFETMFVQKGIAPEVGLDQSAKTTVYACIYDNSWNYLPFFCIARDEDLMTPVYSVEVTHPSIFAGTEEELKNTIIHFAKEKLREVGALKESATCSGLPDEFLEKI